MPIERRIQVCGEKQAVVDVQRLEPAANQPCWGSETAVSLNLTIPCGRLRLLWEHRPKNIDDVADVVDDAVEQSGHT